jgi:L-threonylcarbamoyladenylate synthase
MSLISHDIERAVEILSSGELVAIPTETVYGLAGNALDPLAVAKILKPRIDLFSIR